MTFLLVCFQSYLSTVSPPSQSLHPQPPLKPNFESRSVTYPVCLNLHPGPYTILWLRSLTNVHERYLPLSFLVILFLPQLLVSLPPLLPALTFQRLQPLIPAVSIPNHPYHIHIPAARPDNELLMVHRETHRALCSRVEPFRIREGLPRAAERRGEVTRRWRREKVVLEGDGEAAALVSGCLRAEGDRRGGGHPVMPPAPELAVAGGGGSRGGEGRVGRDKEAAVGTRSGGEARGSNDAG